MQAGIHSLSRRVFNTQELVEQFPPRLQNRNKRVVFDIACPAGARHAGQLAYSRWACEGLPGSVTLKGLTFELEIRSDYFGYEPPPAGSDQVEWYLNFADGDLFCFYGSPLFAQDEMQVAEHPALGSLREALLHSGTEPRTAKEGRPTPILVRGAERRCRIALDPNPQLGRPWGLYGNHFGRASPEAVAQATQPLVPPTITNIVAMRAPAGGYGRYSHEQINFILETAYTAFLAARLESGPKGSATPRVVVHTGYWGCGAFGGNRILMSLLQFLAAQMAGLDRLVFHTGSSAGSTACTTAVATLQRLIQSGRDDRPLDSLVDLLVGLGLEWGVSDGN